MKEIAGNTEPSVVNVNTGGIRVLSCVYIIVNVKNKKFYIGGTTNYNKRKSGHFSKLRNSSHPNKGLQEDFHLYNEEDFFITPLVELPNDKYIVDEVEQMFLNLLYGEQCYNISLYSTWNGKSGSLSPMFGRKVSQEERERLSRINSGSNNYWCDKPEHMAKMRASRKTIAPILGKKHSEETKRRMSEQRKGKQVGIKNNGAIKQSKPVYIEGVIYPSIKEESRELGRTTGFVRHRIKSDKYKDYYCINDKGVETIESGINSDE